MRNLRFLYSFLILLISCNSDDNQNITTIDNRSDQKQVSTFSFLSSNNDIPVNSTATISTDSIHIFLPANTDLSNLTANFTLSKKASFFINNQEIVSGITRLDFSNTSTVKVVAENETSKNYAIKITRSFKNLDEHINTLMSDYNIPGMQIAIIKDEKLVYKKSFGLADKSNNVPVNDETLFRLASVSKPITAIGVLKLAEMNLLDLDDTVFGAEGILETDYGTTPYPEYIKQVTIRHLLNHTSGWKPIDGSDPFFNTPNLTHHQLLSYIINNQPPTRLPGSSYSYSNFGYSILGRIIEKVTGTTYESFTNQHLFTPSGISNIKIGGNTLEEKHPNETVYYPQENISAYGIWDLKMMDSYGGWIASATDLAKLLSKIDRNSSKTDLISENYLQELYFGKTNWSHRGALPGTSTTISRYNNSFSYVALANTTSVPLNKVHDLMERYIKTEISSRTEWPNYDLF